MAREHSEDLESPKAKFQVGPADFASDSLNWLKDVLANANEQPGTDREKLRKDIEGQITVKSDKFDLGKAGDEVDAELSEELKEIRKMNPEALVAGVDGGGYAMKFYEPEFYQPFMEAAKEVKACSGLLDGPTEQWYDNLKPAMDLMIKLGAESPEEFNKTYKKEFYKLVMAKGDKIVYGGAGIFNFLLAFRRAKAGCPALGDADKEGFKVSDLSVKHIKLVLGKKIGKVKGKDERFVSVAERNAERREAEGLSEDGKKDRGSIESDQHSVLPRRNDLEGEYGRRGKDVIDVNGKDPKPGVVVPPAPIGVGRSGENGPVKVPGPGEAGVQNEIPKAGTPEFTRFLDQYGISNSEIFHEAVSTFDGFLKARGMDFLRNPALLKDGSGQYISPPNAQILALFDAGGEVYNLMAQFQQSEDVCEKFYNEHPIGRNYAELYLLTMKKIIDYTQNCVVMSNADKTDQLKAYHASLIKGVDRLRNDPAHKQEALEQLIASAGYLVTNTPDDEDFDGEPGSDKVKWQKLLAVYEAEARK